MAGDEDDDGGGFPFPILSKDDHCHEELPLEIAISCSPIYFRVARRVNPIAICDLFLSPPSRAVINPQAHTLLRTEPGGLADR